MLELTMLNLYSEFCLISCFQHCFQCYLPDYPLYSCSITCSITCSIACSIACSITCSITCSRPSSLLSSILSSLLSPSDISISLLKIYFLPTFYLFSPYRCNHRRLGEVHNRYLALLCRQCYLMLFRTEAISELSTCLFCQNKLRLGI